MSEHFSNIKMLLKKKRLVFCIKLTVLLLLSAMAAILYILFNNELRAFIGSLVLLILCLFQIGVLFKTKTVKIFGKEQRGTVVKKDEKSKIHDKKITGSYGSFSEIRPYEHYRKLVVDGTLFIQKENNEILSIQGLTKDQINFYEVGDEVVILTGAKFPIVLNEPESRQKWLCPICGTVLPSGVDCAYCGLKYK